MNANINVNNGRISTSGSQLAPEPSIQASGAALFTNSGTDLILELSAGNGTSRLVVMSQGSPVSENPIDGIDYIANSVFGSGQQILAGNYVVGKGDVQGFTLTITSLIPGITYHVAVFEYNGTGTSINYNIVNPARASSTP